MSILLFLSQFLRAKVKLIQKLFLPSSLIAGFLGLFLGKQFLNIIPFTGVISSYPYLLVVFLFSSLFIGSTQKNSIKQIMDEVGDTFLINSAVYFGQYALALLLGGAFLLTMFPEMPQAFALLMPGGFIGGHGAAAAFGGAFKELIGWEEALPIGQTFATIGLLVGTIGGIIVINIGTRTKSTRFIKTMNELPESMQTGLVPENEQESMGKNTVSPMSLDPLTWHLVLVLIATCGGYYLTNYLQKLLPSLSIPMFSVAMLCGVALQFVLKALKLTQYVDKAVITRIGSGATDYLVAFGIASIKISVIIKYWVPILVFSLLGVLFVVLYLYFVSRKMFRNFWFERGIFIFGWSTGVIAIGVTLLRIVDPEFKSKALEDYGMAYVFMSFIEIGLIALLPSLVVNGLGFIAGWVCLVIFIALLLITKQRYGIFKGKGCDLRPGETEILAKS
jgi:ESS family glutamate:Na+ symporter